MTRLRRRGGCFLLLFLLAMGLFWWWRAAHPGPLPPLRVALWYWHTPFRVTAADVNELRAMGVGELYVRAGTFRAGEGGLRLVLPQRWETRADGLRVHLVFNFDYGIVRSYATADNAAIERAVLDAVRRERAEAEQAGLVVAGVQLDLDCPTKRLPKYAELLRSLRRRLRAQRLSLSITALQTWFDGGDVRSVMGAVDFTVPQYYEGEVPKSLDALAPVSRIARMRRGLRAAGRTGLPFMAGIPAYGHATVYDRSGRLVGMFRDMGLDDLARRPGFRLLRSYASDAAGQSARRDTAIGEDIHEFAAEVPASDTGQRGYRIVFEVPTPELVRQHLALLRAERPRNCLGVLLFRFPEAGEAATLPLRSLASAWRGERSEAAIRVEVQVRSAPWELIDTGRKASRPPFDVSLLVTNTGSASTYLAPDALRVAIGLDRPGAADVSAGSADTVDAGYVPGLKEGGATTGGLSSGVLRGNVFRFSRLRLAAGETARFGPIRVPADGATKLWGEWSAIGTSGFARLHGEIPVTPLAPKDDR